MYNQKTSAKAATASSNEVWSGQSSVTDANSAQTSKGPALAMYNGKLYMVYRSNDEKGDILYCTFDGNNWTAEQSLTEANGAKTSQGPGLAVYNNKLYVAYRGRGSSNIWYSVLDRNNWSKQTNLTELNNAKTANGPALAAYNGKLYLAYRSDEFSNDRSLRCCSFDGSSWSPYTNITLTNGAMTIDSPALAAYDGNLYAVYLGEGGEHLWYCFLNGDTWFGQTEITQEGKKDDRGPQTSKPVGLEVFKGKLYMVYRGKDSANIWFDSFIASQWGQQASITEQNHAETSTNPGLAVLNGRLYTVYRGKESGRIYSCFLE